MQVSVSIAKTLQPSAFVCLEEHSRGRLKCPNSLKPIDVRVSFHFSLVSEKRRPLYTEPFFVPTPSRDATPGHMVSFSVVPVHWRVLYVNIVSIGFGTFMSRMVAALGCRDLSVLCSRVRDHWGESVDRVTSCRLITNECWCWHRLRLSPCIAPTLAAPCSLRRIALQTRIHR